MFSAWLNDPEDPSWKKLFLKVMGISLLLHLVTAWFSVGHHSPDEYFQILEFLNYKLGRTPVGDLAVEYGEGMRPWFQPAVYYVMAKTYLALGWDDPFGWAFTFRLFAGMMGWMSAVGLGLCTRIWFADPKIRKLVLLALGLIWFYPVLHVRPSSESLAGSTFLIGVALLELRRHSKNAGNWAWWAAGAFFALSFEARFQMGFMILGAALWIFFVAKVRGKALVYGFSGFALVFGLGRLIDIWGYERMVFSPWRYVDYNLIRGIVNTYVHLPWWDIFRISFTETWPFLGFTVLIVTLIAWIKKPLHILTWSCVPFFLIHEVIAHKELRFFFPIAMAAPIMLGLAVTPAMLEWMKARRGFYFAATGLWWFLVANNFVALAVHAVSPFGRDVQFYRAVAGFVEQEGGRLEIVTRDRDPFFNPGLKIHYYYPKGVTVRQVREFSKISQLLNENKKLFLYERTFDLPEEAQDLKTKCTPMFRTIPPWVKSINIGHWVERARVWTLLRCEVQ